MSDRSGKRHGNTIAALVPPLYAQLRSIAHERLRRAPRESLNTTGLVHEAYLRLVESVGPMQLEPGHFLALASRVMRSVLVDSARARTALKRGGGSELVALLHDTAQRTIDLDRVLALDDALRRLEHIDERQAQLIEQRYFGGLTLEEIADTNGLSLATVKRDLRSARAWLATQLADE